MDAQGRECDFPPRRNRVSSPLRYGRTLLNLPPGEVFAFFNIRSDLSAVSCLTNISRVNNGDVVILYGRSPVYGAHSRLSEKISRSTRAL
jgi:hypothetical protein